MCDCEKDEFAQDRVGGQEGHVRVCVAVGAGSERGCGVSPAMPSGARDVFASGPGLTADLSMLCCCPVSEEPLVGGHGGPWALSLVTVTLLESFCLVTLSRVCWPVPSMYLGALEEGCHVNLRPPAQTPWESGWVLDSEHRV